jgi:hypothetical protein
LSDSERQRLLQRSIAPEPPRRTLCLVWRKERYQGRAVRVLVTALREEGARRASPTRAFDRSLTGEQARGIMGVVIFCRHPSSCAGARLLVPARVLWCQRRLMIHQLARTCVRGLRAREAFSMAETKSSPPRLSGRKDILIFLKWTLVIALIACLAFSLFHGWQLQKQLDQVRADQELARRELASIYRVDMVEQSGVFTLKAGRGEPVYFPQSYDAPPAVTLEPVVRPFPNVGGEVNEAKLKQQQKWHEERQLENFKAAMKAFDLVAVYADHFRWDADINRAGGSLPGVEVKWTARGLQRKTAR